VAVAVAGGVTAGRLRQEGVQVDLLRKTRVCVCVRDGDVMR
jgi:hypothetical protein